MLPTKLAASVAAMEEEGKTYAVCDASFWDAEMRVCRRRVRYAHKAHDPAGDASKSLSTQVVLYQREMLNRMGPWAEDLIYGDDWEFTMRIAVLGICGAAVEAALVKVRETPNSISREAVDRRWRGEVACCERVERWAQRTGACRR